jgi:hypothetical protein
MFAFLVVVRPYESIQDNMVEFVNQTFFLFYISTQFYLKTEENWNSTFKNMFIYVLVLNNVVIVIILL